MLRNFLRTCWRCSCTLSSGVLGSGENLQSCCSLWSLNRPIQLRCSTVWQKNRAVVGNLFVLRFRLSTCGIRHTAKSDSYFYTIDIFTFLIITSSERLLLWNSSSKCVFTVRLVPHNKTWISDWRSLLMVTLSVFGVLCLFSLVFCVSFYFCFFLFIIFLSQFSFGVCFGDLYVFWLFWDIGRIILYLNWVLQVSN